MNKVFQLIVLSAGVTAMSLRADYEQLAADKSPDTSNPAKQIPQQQVTAENFDYKQIPFRKDQGFAKQQENLQPGNTPQFLKPLGDPQNSGKTKTPSQSLNKSDPASSSVISLSSALASANRSQNGEAPKDVSTEDQNKLSPSLTMADHSSTLTVAPFLAWVKQNNDASKIAAEKAARYDVSSTQEAIKKASQGITLQIEFPGSTASELSSSSVIYSTPTQ